MLNYKEYSTCTKRLDTLARISIMDEQRIQYFWLVYIYYIILIDDSSTTATIV
jgi:hypothetical protein